jgi:hypothetical protein
MMKRILLSSILILLVGHSVFASPNDSLRKRNNDDQTLFGNSRSLGAFVAWQNKPVWMNDQPGWMTGGQLSLVFGRKLNFGLAGYGLVSPIRSDETDTDGNALYMDMGYGGVMMEPVLFTRSLVHFTVPVLFGMGGAGFRRENVYPNNWDWDDYRGDAFFISEAGVNVEVNLLKWLRFHSGVSYRYVTDGYFGSALSAQLS